MCTSMILPNTLWDMDNQQPFLIIYLRSTHENIHRKTNLEYLTYPNWMRVVKNEENFDQQANHV